VQADGYTLDDKREVIDENDLPDLVKRWKERDPQKDTDRTQKAFFVHVMDIMENKYDLSINRYKKTVYEEEKYDSPLEILRQMKIIEKEIILDMDELENMLR
jgi:type I restriction enzyme M protein